MYLCDVNDIAEEAAKGFKVAEDQQIIVVKKDGLISVFENSCQQLGIPLEMMPDQFLDIERNFIQCSTHGALFEIDNGFCVAGPCAGASLKQYDVELKNNEIHIKL